MLSAAVTELPLSVLGDGSVVCNEVIAEKLSRWPVTAKSASVEEMAPLSVLSMPNWPSIRAEVKRLSLETVTARVAVNVSSADVPVPLRKSNRPVIEKPSERSVAVGVMNSGKTNPGAVTVPPSVVSVTTGVLSVVEPVNVMGGTGVAMAREVAARAARNDNRISECIVFFFLFRAP